MRANDDFAEGWNVEAELRDANSVLAFWRKALAVRKTHEALVSSYLLCSYKFTTSIQIYGDFYPLIPEHSTIFTYTRSLAGTTVLVVLNFSVEEVTVKISLKNPSNIPKRIVLSNYRAGFVEEFDDGDTLTVRGYEGLIYV